MGYKLWVRINESPESSQLIKLNRTYPVWISRYICYEVPSSWFNDLIRTLIDKFGAVYIIQPYSEKEECSPSCKAAKRHECECSCYGQYHGVEYAGNDWFEVSEAYEVRWGPKQWGCRFLTSTDII